MPNPTRRAVLRVGTFAVAALVGIGAGVGRRVHHKVAILPVPPPAALTTALATHRALIAECDATVAATGTKLGTLGSELAGHVDALLAVLQRYPGWRLAAAASTTAAGTSSSAVPSATVSTVSSLRAGLQNQAARLASNCRDWPSGEAQETTVVPLFGSMSACLSGHVGLLS